MDILYPSLIIHPSKAKANIQAMTAKANSLGLPLRPHFKTHQSLAVGRWFKEAGLNRIAVSSLRMAKYFSSEWKDITVAIPVNILESELINELAEEIKLNLTLYNKSTIRLLSERLRYKVNIYIKINIGNNRAGFSTDQLDEIEDVCREVERSPYMELEGLLMHAGHSYKARGQDAVLAVHETCMEKIQALRKRLDASFQDLVYSYGDTPTCSVAAAFPGVDEMRPGNFVFYDLTQAAIGSCKQEDIAVALACPVIGKQSAEKKVIIHGGGVHLSKDSLLLPSGEKLYGRIIRFGAEGWEYLSDENKLVGISQEHGVLVLDDENYNQVEIGDVLGVLPAHSCMTADLMKVYQDEEGKRYPMMQYI